MMHWLYPANVKMYDVFAAFSQQETYWPINSKVAVGDVVYFYLAAPFKQIGYVTEVQEINLSHDNIIDQIRAYLKNSSPAGKQEKLFMQLKVKARVPINAQSETSYTRLKQNGLNGMLMGPRKLENTPALLNYIKGACDGIR